MKKILDESRALCEVYTYKEGILSALGHDLRIKAAAFMIALKDMPPVIRAAFDTGSLQADCAMEADTPRPGLLSEKDKREIDENMRKDVLETGKYEEILFLSSGITKNEHGYHIEGGLALHGVSRQISFEASEKEGYYVSDVRIHLPDFGMKPFSAAFGAMRIKPDILVKIKIPASELEGFL